MSLLNDKETNKFDLLLLSEPFRFTPKDGTKPLYPKHHAWEAVTPTTFTPTTHQRFNFRSMIYINKRLKYKAIPTKCSDLTVITIQHGNDTMVVISVYVANASGRQESNQILETTLNYIREAIQTARAKAPEASLLIAGDFNRHDEVWRGRIPVHGRRGEADLLLQFITEQELWNALPQGTPTYHNLGETTMTTIDLVLLSTKLQPAVLACQTDPIDHGSDHFATALTLRHMMQTWTAPKQRRSYNMADWDAIREALQSAFDGLAWIKSADELEKAAAQLERAVQEALELHTPKPKAFPYPKSWWTRELTEQRKEYNFRRNQWTQAVRRGDFDQEIKRAAQEANRSYLAAIASQKKTHWKEFLDDHQNVWKALQALEGQDRTWAIPPLKTENGLTDEDEVKAKVLLKTFFPPQPMPVRVEGEDTPYEQEDPNDPIGAPIREEEVRRAIFSSNPRKAAGPDDIPFKVWQEVWPVVGKWVTLLYQRSIALQHVPRTWAEAKIMVIPKPGKPDYSIPKAYRPISLLRIISKGLERVVAQRLSEFCERTDRLSPTQFGARPRRSTEQALAILVEKAYDAWRVQDVLSLVTFDVQGAYNGVNKDILKERLEACAIPKVLVGWIYSFCSNRAASITLGEFKAEMEDITFPGLPQGSPLSPILYILYNNNLLRGQINRKGGDMGFVDDFTGWAVSKSGDENTMRLQREVIPRVRKWERESGATFKADKTQFIHFTRFPERAQQPWMPLRMGECVIYPRTSVKVLGVTLDAKLKMKEHMHQAIVRAKTQALALTRIKGLRPPAMRKLYLATVASKLDYAAPIWWRSKYKGVETASHIEAIQKIGSIAITGAFRTAAGKILEIEAGLVPTALRIQQRIIKFIINLHTLPEGHPWWNIHESIQKLKPNRKSREARTPIRDMVRAYQRIVHQGIQRPLEKIMPFVQNPAATRTSIKYIIHEDREVAIAEAKTYTPSQCQIYTDGSARKGLVGIGVTWRKQHLIRRYHTGIMNHFEREGEWDKDWETIGIQTNTNEYVAELTAILRAMQILTLHPEQRFKQPKIFTDCQAAILSIKETRLQSGQQVLQKIWETAGQLYQGGTTVVIQWAPAHEGIEGNERAHMAARMATAKGVPAPRVKEPMLRSRAIQRCKEYFHAEMLQTFDKKKVGRFTTELDKALPQQHMRAIYKTLSREETNIVVQLRTDHTHLNTTLAQIRIAPSAECECGNERETIKHFLLECPQWTEQRTELRHVLGERWADLPYTLGGWSGRFQAGSNQPIDGPKNKWKPNVKVIRTVIKFVQATGRFRTQAVMPKEERVVEERTEEQAEAGE